MNGIRLSKTNHIVHYNLEGAEEESCIQFCILKNVHTLLIELTITDLLQYFEELLSFPEFLQISEKLHGDHLSEGVSLLTSANNEFTYQPLMSLVAHVKSYS